MKILRGMENTIAGKEMREREEVEKRKARRDLAIDYL